METEDTSAKRQLLARKNYGRRQLPEFLDRLSFAFSQRLEPDHLLSLEETDAVHGQYTELLKAVLEDSGRAYLETWTPEHRDALELKLKCFRTNVNDVEVILFSRGFDVCGALRTHLHKVLERAFELLLVDGDSVLLLDESRTNGILIDVYDDIETGDEKYEMIIWGNEWARAISKC